MEFNGAPTDPEARYSYHDTTKWGNKLKVSYQKSLFSRFLPSLAKGALIIEIGTGRGEFAQETIRRGYDYIGVEPSTGLREHLVSQGYKILSQAIPKIELPDNSVDLVHSADVIEHLPSYFEALDFLSESYRILREGGYVSVIAPNYNTLKSLFFAYDYQHTFITNQERIEGLLRDSGFRVTRSVSFLTSVGLTRFRLLDRTLVHTILPFARNSLLCSLARSLIGRDLVFKLHKNLYDHIGVIGKKQTMSSSKTCRRS
jgi:SAM-dependent methyltransferase